MSEFYSFMSVARATHQLLSHDLTNVIYEVVTVQGGGR